MDTQTVPCHPGVLLCWGQRSGGVSKLIVHSTKLLDSDWTRAVQLIRNDGKYPVLVLTFPQSILGPPQWIITSRVSIHPICWATIVRGKHYDGIFIHPSVYKSFHYLTQDEYRNEKHAQCIIKMLTVDIYQDKN